MFYQLTFLLVGVLSSPFLPVLFILGTIAKKKTGKLPDAIGPSGKIKGSNQGLKLAVLGESTVAGVGVDNHEEGVTGQIATFLNNETGKEVIWEAIGSSGFTARKVNDHLIEEISKRIPDIFISIKINKT